MQHPPEPGARADAEEEDERRRHLPCCRICLVAEEDHTRLSCPCGCKGTQQFVHEACLFSWIDQSTATRCAVCKMSYVVSPVYAADAPSSLPVGDVIRGLVGRLMRGALLLGRLVLVSITWFVVVPMVTASFWRLAFARSLRQACVQIVSRLRPVLVVLDCINGCFLSLSVVFFLTGISTLRAHIKHLLVVEAGDRDLDEDRGGGAGRGGADGEGAADPAGAEGVAVHGGGPQDAGDDEDDDEDDPFRDELNAMDDLTLEDLIGLRGPLHRLWEHAATLAASNGLSFWWLRSFPSTSGTRCCGCCAQGRSSTRQHQW
uniref:RING-type E3 ubiquitin transferase n=1 Tax=Mantoniella antarctica TaxID=81844 RepID=A0A7S0X453_9CHLO|mmetsp:Transcript_15540/g.38154  ORF Transcript_15540/g.38154 Transcript_15540/m.38154 type:complete len:317 (+) Transcript_15540:160-1110(+)